MKRLFACTALLAASAVVFGQANPPASPPEKAAGAIDGKTITISYSSPSVKGREGHIFTKDGLISRNPHYPVWRAGANAATTLETSADLRIGDVDVPKGTYTLFVDIADPDQWVLIINKKTGEWGLSYDASQDLGKTKMMMSKPSPMMEHLKYEIKDEGGKRGKLILAWENHEAAVPIEVR